MAAFLISLAAVLVAIHAATVAHKVWTIRREADEAWARRDEEDSIDTLGVGEQAFKRAYFRAYGPRASLHVYAGAAIAAVLTLPALAALDAVWTLLWRLSDSPRAYAPGNLVWQFYIYFATPAIWVAVVHAAIRRYHRNRPRELRTELLRERTSAASAQAPASPG